MTQRQHQQGDRRRDDPPRRCWRPCPACCSGMFVAILSSTVVSNALPRIVTDLGRRPVRLHLGRHRRRCWRLTVDHPDLGQARRPLRPQEAAGPDRRWSSSCVGSVLAGLSQSTGHADRLPRASRASAPAASPRSSRSIMAAIDLARASAAATAATSARSSAVATVARPADRRRHRRHAWLGWRWCFYVGVPFAVAALVVLQKTLHLPRRQARGHASTTLGAALIAGGVSLLLIWVSLAGHQFDWLSWQTARSWSAGGVALLGRSPSRRAPGRASRSSRCALFRDRTIALAVIASVAVGVAMFGTTVFLSQYFQIARGKSPDRCPACMTIPMVVGLLVASTVVGPDHHPHRPLEALPGRRRGPAHRRPRPDGHAATTTPAWWQLARLHGAASALGLGMTDAEPRARRAEHGPRSATSARPARWSRSSAASAARSASPRSARCSATGSGLHRRRPGRAGHPGQQLGQRRRAAGRARPARPGPHRRRERLRRRRRRHLPGRRPVRADRADRGALHQGGPAAPAPGNA